ncbi:MAG: hypothetical protein IKU37_05680 [Candidatus Gastranaerophilales bacterium]|nr:hypothetical protein [Candidatus Gastranaerophilales bacterium]
MNVSFRPFQPAFGSAQDKRNMAQAKINKGAVTSGYGNEYDKYVGFQNEKEELLRMHDEYIEVGDEENAQECLEAVKLVGADFAALQRQLGIARSDGSCADGRSVCECSLDGMGRTSHVGRIPHSIY